jgi:hypothetical protein
MHRTYTTLPAFDDQAGSQIERFDDITTSLEVFIRSFKTLTHLSCEVSQAFYLLYCQCLRLKIRRQSSPLLLQCLDYTLKATLAVVRTSLGKSPERDRAVAPAVSDSFPVCHRLPPGVRALVHSLAPIIYAPARSATGRFSPENAGHGPAKIGPACISQRYLPRSVGPHARYDRGKRFIRLILAERD